MLRSYIDRKEKLLLAKIISKNNGTIVGQYTIFHLSLQSTEMTDWYFNVSCCKNFPLENLSDERYSQRALCLCGIQLNMKLSQILLTFLFSILQVFFPIKDGVTSPESFFPVFWKSGHMPGAAFTTLSDKVEHWESVRAIYKCSLSWKA